MRKYCVGLTLVLAAGTFLSACGANLEEEATESVTANEVPQSYESNSKAAIQNKASQYSSGVLLYGEGVKGNIFGTTVNNAFEKEHNNTAGEGKASTKYVVVNVTFKNIREDGNTADPANVTYELQGNKKGSSYKGVVIPEENPINTEIQFNESISLDVYFEVPVVKEEYKFYVDISDDPITVHWKLKNVAS